MTIRETGAEMLGKQRLLPIVFNSFVEIMFLPRPKLKDSN